MNLYILRNLLIMNKKFISFLFSIITLMLNIIIYNKIANYLTQSNDFLVFFGIFLFFLLLVLDYFLVKLIIEVYRD
jgi:ATP/ADP translocase